MATITHSSPLGDLEVPTVLSPVPPGVPIDVDDDIALALLAQGDLFRLVSPPKVTDLRQLAARVGIDSDGLTREQLVTALAVGQIPDVLTTTTIVAADEAAQTEETNA